MSPPDWRVAFMRRAFLRHAPGHYALMLTLDAAERLGQKYLGRRGAITDVMIARHLDGAIALAAPAAVNGRAHLLPLDIDAGGIDAMEALMTLAQLQSLWAFGHYTPRMGLDEDEQRGYVWLPFDAFVEAERLQLLGAQLIAALDQPLWKIEVRATHAVTRLPLARHTHTGRFGDLVLGERRLSIDEDPIAAFAELADVYRENSINPLPTRSPSVVRSTLAAPSEHRQGISIARFNAGQNLGQLLERYGARRVRSGRQLYHCPFHDDTHASLSVYVRHGRQYCWCFSAHSNCPLSGHANDAFNVYCFGEQIDPREALRRLNKRS